LLMDPMSCGFLTTQVISVSEPSGTGTRIPQPPIHCVRQMPLLDILKMVSLIGQVSHQQAVVKIGDDRAVEFRQLNGRLSIRKGRHQVGHGPPAEAFIRCAHLRESPGMVRAPPRSNYALKVLSTLMGVAGPVMLSGFCSGN
jgi:hypothetical protein